MNWRLETRQAMSCLDVPDEAPHAYRAFRSATVMSHARARSAGPWRWSGAAEFAVVVYPASEVSGVTEATLLIAGRPACIPEALCRAAMTVWVSMEALIDLTGDGRNVPLSLGPSPLVNGLRGFAASLLDPRTSPTAYSGYLVERLLTEFVFGAVLEASPQGVDGAQSAERPIDRARNLMLLKREDPTFGAEQLAEAMHMSVRQLQRVFAKAGSSPAEELRRMRVDVARTILEDEMFSALSVGQVADYAGFRNAAAMRRAFVAQGLPLPSRIVGGGEVQR